MKDVDPSTGEPESDDTYEDSYVVSFLFVIVSILKISKKSNVKTVQQYGK